MGALGTSVGCSVQKASDCSLSIIAVNTLLLKEYDEGIVTDIKFVCSTGAEKMRHIENVVGHQKGRNAYAASGLASLQKIGRDHQNVFVNFREAVKNYCLVRIPRALYDVDGEHRRNM